MTERERYEKWLTSGLRPGSTVRMFEKLPNGDYLHQIVLAGWRAWEARAAIALAEQQGGR